MKEISSGKFAGIITKEKQSGIEVSRRAFITSGAATAVGVGLLGNGLLISPDAWAKGALDEHASSTLLIMARDLYPNDDLEDIHYANIISPMGEKASKDPTFSQLLSDGVTELDKHANQRFDKNYSALEKEIDRVEVLNEIETSGFFATIRHTVMLGIYNNKELWPRFGYGGSSWEQGGYINRGFDEIDWL